MDEVLNISVPKRTLETITGEIRALKQQSLACIVEIGRRLCEAKELLPHGEWGNWLSNEVQFSQSTANNFMRLFSEYGSAQSCLFGAETNSQTLGNLSYTKALRLLAVPENEREDFAKEHDVESLSTRELDALIRERDEALKAKEAAEKKALEADEGSALALAEVQKKAEAAAERAQELEDKVKLSEERAAELNRELTELKNRPIEVAVQVDEKAVSEAAEQARAQAEKDYKKQIKELSAKIKEAEKEKEDSENLYEDAVIAKNKAEELLAEIQAEKEALSAEAQKARKAAAMSDPATAQFKALFAETQNMMNRMLELAKEAGENKDKLFAVLAALCKQIGEAVA